MTLNKTMEFFEFQWKNIFDSIFRTEYFFEQKLQNSQTFLKNPLQSQFLAN